MKSTSLSPGAFAALRRWARSGESTWLLRPFAKAAYSLYFSRAAGFRRLFRGVYNSFEAALEAAPKGRPIGYDTEQGARLYLDNLPETAIFPNDYPVLFWLKSLLGQESAVFDYGGNIGILYYSYRTRMAFPPGLKWVVCDVPEVVKLGTHLAAARESKGLGFTSVFSDAEGADVLLAAGSLQFIQEPLATLLSGLSQKPAHLLINKLPLCEGPSFVTIQNTGAAFCPYRIFNKLEFRASLEAIGYVVVDAWKNPDLPFRLPFHPKRSFDAYSGLYCKLQ